MSPTDWVLYVVLPLLLVVAGVVLYLRGRAALQEARAIKGGFGGPPGSADIGLELGRSGDPDRHRKDVLGAQRQMLWGGILGGVGLVWLLVALLTKVM